MTSKEYAIIYLKQLKGKPLKEQIMYIFTYYWIPIIVTLGIVVFLISLVVHYGTMKTSVLSVCCVNSVADEEKMQEYMDIFVRDQGLDSSEYDVTLRLDMVLNTSDVSTGYQNTQILLGLLGEGLTDVMAADTETIVHYAYQGAYSDLSQILDSTQMEGLSPYLLYIDLAYLDRLEKAPSAEPLYPDPTKPEDMECPVPVAMKMSAEWELAEIGYRYVTDDVALGLVANSENAENSKAFLLFVLEREMGLHGQSAIG